MGPGLQILPSSQGSQADPVREKMASWKDTTNNDLSPHPVSPQKKARQLPTWLFLQDYLQLCTQIETHPFNIQLTHQWSRAACVSHGAWGPTEGQLEEQEGQKGEREAT